LSYPARRIGALVSDPAAGFCDDQLGTTNNEEVETMAQIEPTVWYDVIADAVTDMYVSKCIVLEEADSLVASLGPKAPHTKVLKEK